LARRHHSARAYSGSRQLYGPTLIGVIVTLDGLLLVAAVLPWFVILISKANKSFAWGLGLVSLPILADLVAPIPSVELGRLSLDPTLDLAGGSLFAIGIIRHIRKKSDIGAARVAFIIVGVYLAVLLLSIINFGFADSLDFKRHLLVVAGIIYGTSFSSTYAQRRAVFSVIFVVALGITVISIAAWSGLGGLGRELPAAAALVLGQAGVLTVNSAIERKVATPTLMASGAAFISLATLLQHRSVWVSMAVGLLVSAVLSGRAILRLVPIAAIAALVIATVAGLGLGFGRDAFQGETVADSFLTAATADNTYNWRREYRELTIDTHIRRGPIAVAFGAGYGAPWMDQGPLIDRTEGPHNTYVEVVVRYGVVGLSFWLLLIFATARRLWARRTVAQGTGMSNQALLSLLAMQAVFMLAYEFSHWQPVLFGFCVAASYREVISKVAGGHLVTTDHGTGEIK
jgi:hypothetical protein